MEPEKYSKFERGKTIYIIKGSNVCANCGEKEHRCEVYRSGEKGILTKHMMTTTLHKARLIM